MMKALQIALIVAVLAFGLTSVAEACGCPTDPYAIDAMGDQQRYEIARSCGLPEAPEGKAWAEDFGLVDAGFWS